MIDLPQSTMNEIISGTMFLHALFGLLFMVGWKILYHETNGLLKRAEWISAIAILLAFAGAKENIDRELTIPALLDVLSYVWLAPLAMWAMKKYYRDKKSV